MFWVWGLGILGVKGSGRKDFRGWGGKVSDSEVKGLGAGFTWTLRTPKPKPF